ncbi:Putative aminophospholipid-translocase [Sparganum proliferum]
MTSHLLGTLLLTHIACAFFSIWTNLNPRELTAAVRDTNSIELAWKPPRTQAWESLIYEIRVNGQFNQITGNTHVTIYDLTPSTKYTFRVQTVNTNYEVVYPGISVTETTPNQADLNPSELNALVLNLTYVLLSWKQPNVSITSQAIFCIFQNGIPRRTTIRRKVNITGLTPHTKYVFGVQTVHSNGDYIAPGVNVTVSTDDLSTYDSYSAACQPWSALFVVALPVIMCF